MWLQMLFKYLAGKKSPSFGRRSLGNWLQIGRRSLKNHSGKSLIGHRSLAMASTMASAMANTLDSTLTNILVKL